MINKNFVAPEPEVSKAETDKRLDILKNVKDIFSKSCPVIFVGGSMATSQNFGVHPDSDIDTQLLTTPETVHFLKDTSFFDNEKLDYYITGYLKGYAEQFSLNGEIDGVTVECHFWDKDGYFRALKNHEESVLRFRSSNTGSSINNGFGFKGEEQETDYPTDVVEEWFVSPFPFYEHTDKSFFPCRPLTNLLGTPIIVQGEEELLPYIDELWKWTIAKLKEYEGEDVILDEANLINAMPGNWKFNNETRETLTKRTIRELGR